MTLNQFYLIADIILGVAILVVAILLILKYSKRYMKNHVKPAEPYVFPRQPAIPPMPAKVNTIYEEPWFILKDAKAIEDAVFGTSNSKAKANERRKATVLARYGVPYAFLLRRNTTDNED